MRRFGYAAPSGHRAGRRARHRAGLGLALAAPVLVPFGLTWAVGEAAASGTQGQTVVVTGPASWSDSAQAWARGAGVQLSYVAADGSTAAGLLDEGKAQAAIVAGTVHTSTGAPRSGLLYAPVAAAGTVVVSAVPDLSTGRIVTDLRVDARTLAELYTGDVDSAAARLQALNPNHRLPDSLTALALEGPTAQTRQLSSYLTHSCPRAWPNGIVASLPLAQGQVVARDNAAVVAAVNAALQRRGLQAGVIGYADAATALTQPDAARGTVGTSPSGATSTAVAGTALNAPDTVAAVRNAAGQYVLPTATALSLGAADLVKGGAGKEIADLPGPVTDPRAYPVSSEVFLAVPAALRSQSPGNAVNLAGLVRYATRAGQYSLPVGAAALPPGDRDSADAVAGQLDPSSPGPSGSPTPSEAPSETPSPSGSPTGRQPRPRPSTPTSADRTPTSTATPSATPTATHAPPLRRTRLRPRRRPTPLRRADSDRDADRDADQHRHSDRHSERRQGRRPAPPLRPPPRADRTPTPAPRLRPPRRPRPRDSDRDGAAVDGAWRCRRSGGPAGGPPAVPAGRAGRAGREARRRLVLAWV